MAPSLNPQIQTLDIGKKELRKITVYPLSLKDQLSLPETISESFIKLLGNYDDLVTKGKDQLSEKEEQTTAKDLAIINDMTDIVAENLDAILALVTDEEKPVSSSEITNLQLSELVEIIFSVNYESAVGKVKSVVARAQALMSPKKTEPETPEKTTIGPQPQQ